jgi:PAS domain S-box-containing protein
MSGPVDREVKGALAREGLDPALFSDVLDLALQATSADLGAIHGANEREEGLRLLAYQGWGEMPPARVGALAVPPAAWAALRSGAPEVIADLPQSPLFRDDPDGLRALIEAGIHAAQLMPILSPSGERLGVLSTFYRSERVPSEDTLIPLSRFARHLAGLLGHDRLDASFRAEARRCETALVEAEQRFHVLVETLAQAVWEGDPAGNQVRGSESWSAFTGQTVDEMSGLGWLDAVHPDDRSIIAQAWEGAIAAQRPLDAEFRLRRAGGGWRWTHVHAAPILGPDGVVRKWVGMNIDITQRKEGEERLRASEEQLRLAQEGAGIGSWDWNVVTGEMVHSPRCLEIFGLPPTAEMPFSLFAQLVHPEDWPWVDGAIQQALRDGSPYELEFRIRPRDGGLRWVAMRGQAFLDAGGRPVRMAGLAIDVTDRRQAEDELQKAKERIEQEDHRKTEFLAVLSHELRNPLAPIRNSIVVLDRAPPGSEAAARAREVLHRQTDHLVHLIEDLLDVTRIARGKVEVHPARCDLREIAQKACDDHHGIFLQAGVELRLDVPPAPVWIHADQTRMDQVIGNLLQNAVKFTQPGGRVQVRVSSAQNAEIAVRDNGIGIDPADSARLFEPFAQGPQGLARSRGGLGLGLALVKGLVELQGGSVQVESEGPGKGSEFRVRLPLATVAEKAPQEASDAPGGGKLILVIEDNPDAGQTLADVLELNGHRVRVAHDGATGIALARQLKPDVVLCDIGLPDLDGYEVARRLRREEPLRSTHLIAISGYAQPEDRARAKEAGFDQHLAKPARPDELMNALAQPHS